MHPETLAPQTKQSLEILSQSTVFKDFYMAGGTGLALQLGHRISEDLDWFTEKEFRPLSLLARIKKELPQIKIENVQQSWGTLKFFHHGTMVSFFIYPYPLLEKTVDYQKMKVADLVDIGCMKITSIADRGVKKDFVDLYFILQEIPFDQLIKKFQEKYADYNLEFYHYLKSLIYFEEADNSPAPQMLKSAPWTEVKSFLVEKIIDYPLK